MESNKNHFIYVTNRNISPVEEEAFLTQRFQYKDKVTVSIFDLTRISTALASPDLSQDAYKLLGITVPDRIHAEAKDIAISTLLLFSNEAKELRDEIIEACIKSFIFKHVKLKKDNLIELLLKTFQFENIKIHIEKSISNLVNSKHIFSDKGVLTLSENECKRIEAANTNFILTRDADINYLSRRLSIQQADAAELLDCALEIITRNRNFEGETALEEDFREILSRPSFRNRKNTVREAIAETTSANMKQYGFYIEKILSSDTFDIYRALAGRTSIIALLDSSVAMPLLFGLEFGEIDSRFENATHSLKNMCDAHGIQICVPNSYINEIAAHGRLALEKIPVYEALPDEAKGALKASGNAYISHYTHIRNKLSQKGEELSLNDFLQHFGIQEGCSIYSIENKIISLFDKHGISTCQCPLYTEDIFRNVKNMKEHDSEIIIKHDAAVLTLIKEDIKSGFILVTWDNIMQELAQNLARVLAETPTRTIDFLSMAKSKNLYAESNVAIIELLRFIDEQKVLALAEKIDKIENIEQAYKLQAIIDECRATHGDDWELGPEDIQKVLEDNVE